MLRLNENELGMQMGDPHTALGDSHIQQGARNHVLAEEADTLGHVHVSVLLVLLSLACDAIDRSECDHPKQGQTQDAKHRNKMVYSHTRLPLSGPQVIEHEAQSSDHEVLVQHVEMRAVGSVFRHLLHGSMIMRFEHMPFSLEIEHTRE